MKNTTMFALLCMILGTILMLNEAPAPTPTPLPVPPVDPIDPPVDPVDPVEPVDPPPVDPVEPVGDPENRFLSVYESADKSTYPPAQVAIFTSTTMAEYLDTNCTTEIDGEPAWRMWDQDVTMSSTTPDAFVEAMGMDDRTSLPWAYITNGQTDGYSGPLPATVDDTIALCKEIFTDEGKQ